MARIRGAWQANIRRQGVDGLAGKGAGRNNDNRTVLGDRSHLAGAGNPFAAQAPGDIGVLDQGLLAPSGRGAPMRAPALPHRDPFRVRQTRLVPAVSTCRRRFVLNRLPLFGPQAKAYQPTPRLVASWPN